MLIKSGFHVVLENTIFGMMASNTSFVMYLHIAF
jgi:hypothetical protein